VFSVVNINPVDIEVTENRLIIPATTTSVLTITDGGTREVLRNVTPGTNIHVIALAQNSAGKSPWGPIVSAFAA
jgi:hypothetical protein